jgi:NAD(P)-dependent dehydrogenase (short-subunit alcohol dehydrogenase family)
MKQEPMLFTGQGALITGASHGIGAVTVRMLASLVAAVAGLTPHSPRSSTRLAWPMPRMRQAAKW